MSDNVPDRSGFSEEFQRLFAEGIQNWLEERHGVTIPVDLDVDIEGIRADMARLDDGHP